MISNSKHLVNLARSFSARGEYDERIDVIILRGTFAGTDEQSAWLRFSANPPAPFTYIQVYDVEVSGDVTASEAFQSARAITINIRKETASGAAFFIFQKAASAFVQDRNNRVYGLFCVEIDASTSFITRGMSVSHWDVEKSIEALNSVNVINPRNFVRALVPCREVVLDLSPWLLETSPICDSELYQNWQQQSARSLLGAIVNTASAQNSEIYLETKGPPSWKVKVEPNLSNAFVQISNAAKWTYCSGEDRDVRHLILSSEIGRAARADIMISEIIAFALENAKVAYEAHVQSASRETLKALTDLRKTVIEDTQKVTERARSLTGDLWRDVAVTATPFVVKELQDTAMSKYNSVQAFFYFGAAAFICISFALQTQLNSAFFADQERARDKWLEALFKYISQSERQKIVGIPIEDAMRTYRTTRNTVASLYLLLVAILIIAGVRTLGP